MDLDLSTLTDAELALLKRRVTVEHNKRTSKAPMDLDGLYALFTTKFTSFALLTSRAEDFARGGYGESQIDGPYQPPTLEEFEVLVKRFKTAAKTEKGILTWMERAWRDWSETVAKAQLAAKKHALVIQGLEYRLANEQTFPRSIWWNEPMTPREKRVLAAKFPYLKFVWGDGTLTFSQIP